MLESLGFMASKYPVTEPRTLGRRKPEFFPTEEIIYEAAVFSFIGGDPLPDIVSAITDGFQRADARVFQIIAIAAERVDSPCHTTFSRCVAAARIVAGGIMRREGRIPTKREVRKIVVRKLGDRAYDEKQSSRWIEVWKGADIQDLPLGKLRP